MIELPGHVERENVVHSNAKIRCTQVELSVKFEHIHQKAKASVHCGRNVVNQVDETTQDCRLQKSLIKTSYDWLLFGLIILRCLIWKCVGF